MGARNEAEMGFGEDGLADQAAQVTSIRPSANAPVRV
jgi:hypothetical protein